MAKQIAATSGNKSITALDEELRKEVAALRSQIGESNSRLIKLRPTGSFESPEGIDLGDSIQVVVLDFISKNLYYKTPYVEGQASVPDCFAMGRVIADMKPDPESPDIQNEDCATCPMNQFGSGKTGRNKACQNRRELAVLLVDPNDPDAHNSPKARIYLLSLSPSNITSFDSFVANTMRTLNSPPIKVVITVSGRNVGTYAVTAFHSPEPNRDYAAHLARRPEAAELLTRRPDFSGEANTTKQPPARRRAAQR